MRKLPRNKPRILYRLFFGLVIVLGLVVCVFLGWQYWQKDWDGQSRYTLIEIGEEVTLKSYDPITHQGFTIFFPKNLEIETVSGRGFWQIGALNRAGSSKWAADSIADYLGISYNGVGGITNRWDRFQWGRMTRAAIWKEIDLSESNYLELVKTPDNLEVFRLSRTWDTKARELFLDQPVAQEAQGVIIINTVSYPGLGTNAGRVVESLGMATRGIETQEESIERCLVQGSPDLKDTASARKLMKVFHCQWEDSDDTDLHLFLGEEYRTWKWGE